VRGGQDAEEGVIIILCWGRFSWQGTLVRCVLGPLDAESVGEGLGVERRLALGGERV
jgi:hypothetical protein